MKYSKLLEELKTEDEQQKSRTNEANSRPQDLPSEDALQYEFEIQLLKSQLD